MNHTRTREGDTGHVVIRRCDTHHKYFVITAAILNPAYQPETALVAGFSRVSKRFCGVLDLRC